MKPARPTGARCSRSSAAIGYQSNTLRGWLHRKHNYEELGELEGGALRRCATSGMNRLGARRSGATGSARCSSDHAAQAGLVPLHTG